MRSFMRFTRCFVKLQPELKENTSSTIKMLVGPVTAMTETEVNRHPL